MKCFACQVEWLDILSYLKANGYVAGEADCQFQPMTPEEIALQKALERADKLARSEAALSIYKNAIPMTEDSVAAKYRASRGIIYPKGDHRIRVTLEADYQLKVMVYALVTWNYNTHHCML
ncbi:MAG: hypothetical protein GXP05_16505 [Alphaproteobacteria bacterium]|nr:hypothetical protein [Alphaproteobacteria bacterium]